MSLLVCFCCLLPASCDTAPRPGVCHLCAGQVPGSGGYWTSDLPEWLHLLPPPPVLLCRWKGLPQPWEASWPFSFPPPRGFSGSKACGCHRPFPLPCAAASVPASPSTPTHKSPWFLYLPSPPSHPGPRLRPTSPEPPSNSDLAMSLPGSCVTHGSLFRQKEVYGAQSPRVLNVSRSPRRLLPQPSSHAQVFHRSARTSGLFL